MSENLDALEQMTLTTFIANLPKTENRRILEKYMRSTGAIMDHALTNLNALNAAREQAIMIFEKQQITKKPQSRDVGKWLNLWKEES